MRLPVQETQETQGHDWVTERAHKHLQHCHTINILSVSSAAQSCLTLCNPMDYNTPGLPVHHQLLEFTQSHVHWVGDAIQPSHPLSSPSPPAFNLSQHQGLLKCVNSLHQISASTSALPMNISSFRMDWLDLLAVQGTLKSLLQQHSSKASILRCSSSL